MSNELKDIAYRLAEYDNSKGWEITKAEKICNGKWSIEVQNIEMFQNKTKESADEDDK